MGEKVEIKQIEIINQEGITLLQIDFKIGDENKWHRAFIDANEFFKMLSKNK